jgi:hypothetical protein
MVRRKGELSASTFDRKWQHQVRLPADQITGKNNAIIAEFCRELSLCPRGQPRLRPLQT